MKRIFLIALVASLFLSCKKEKPTVIPINAGYQKINRVLSVNDTRPLTLDVNQDGQVDYVFFIVRTALSNGDALYVGTNPIGKNAAKMAIPDDTRFQNMGQLFAAIPNQMIDQKLAVDQLWDIEFSYLTIRNVSNIGSNYLGDWGNETEKIMQIQLNANGENHYGWVRLVFNRANESLTLIDCAWNKTANQGIKAGQTN